MVASAADLARLVAAIDGDSRVRDVINANSVAAMTAHDDNDKMSRGWSEVDAKGNGRAPRHPQLYSCAY